MLHLQTACGHMTAPATRIGTLHTKPPDYLRRHITPHVTVRVILTEGISSADTTAYLWRGGDVTAPYQ